jgi:hypothetical protein
VGGIGNWDVSLIKTDSSGNKTWDKAFGGWTQDVGQSVIQTMDGGYIIAGRTVSYAVGGSDVYLIKTDSSGNKTWEKTFGSTGVDGGESVSQTADGGYIIAGWTNSYGAGLYDVWLIKTDSSGNKTWDKTFGGVSNDRGCSVSQTTDGGYIISGWTESYGAGNHDVWIIKTDTNGNKTWDKIFGGTGDDEGNSGIQTTDKGYVIAGITDSYGAGAGDIWLLKVSDTPTCVGGNVYQVNKLQIILPWLLPLLAVTLVIAVYILMSRKKLPISNNSP